MIKDNIKKGNKQLIPNNDNSDNDASKKSDTMISQSRDEIDIQLNDNNTCNEVITEFIILQDRYGLHLRQLFVMIDHTSGSLRIFRYDPAHLLPQIFFSGFLTRQKIIQTVIFKSDQVKAHKGLCIQTETVPGKIHRISKNYRSAFSGRRGLFFRHIAFSDAAASVFLGILLRRTFVPAAFLCFPGRCCIIICQL